MKSKGRIGVIIPHVSCNIDTQFIDEIHRTAVKYGYDTIVVTGAINYVDDHLDAVYSKGQINIYDLILHGDFDGFIFEANIFCSEKLRKMILDLLSKKGTPCVVVNYEQPYFPVVSADETKLLYLSAMHMIKEHNCRKLYCIGGVKGHKPSEERINGFRMAMEENGLKYNDDCIFYGNYWKDIPRRIASDIAEGKLEKPDAIICGSDIMAIEVCRTLTGYGIKIPDEIAVTGCDGSVISQNEIISVTTSAGQERINGALAVTKLFKMMGEDISTPEKLPELVTGESCGCCGTGGGDSSCSRDEIREYAGVIFRLLDERRTNSHGEMIRRMSECRNIYDVLGTFTGCCYMIPGGIRAELCLCEDWCRDFDDPSVFRREDYPDTMLLGIDTGDDSNEKLKRFPAKDIFLSLKEPHEPRLTVITSLHYKGQIFGYVGITYKKAVHIVLDDFYMSWCDTISSGLNTVQNRVYKEYVNKRIESLSEFAPVLGIYNKRGMINKLMNLMAENSSSVITLTLLSYIKEERVHYNVPPINSIVNAIRISDDKAVPASLGDDIIAIVLLGETENISKPEFKAEIRNKVLNSYKGTVEIKEDRIVNVSCRIRKADIFAIDDLINEMEDKLKGRIISQSSGTFNYKERFESLRNDIMKHPEKEWNVDTITRSMGLSKSHFQRIYKELFKTSCKEDIINSRMEKIKWMLENTTLSISQISEQCGYSNVSHFIRQFTNKTGSTPSAYRKRTKEDK